MRNLIVLSILAVCLHQILCSKILALMTVLSHSHHQWNLIYLKALAARGHQITYLGVENYKNPSPNISYIQIEDAFESYDSMDMTDLSDKSHFTSLDELYEGYNSQILKYGKKKGFQQFLNTVKTEKFDLVVYDLATISFWLGAVDLIGRPPVIGITAFGVPEWSMDYSGTPYPIQNNPHFLLPLGKNMDFWERLYNTGVFYYAKLLRQYYHVEHRDREARKAFGEGIRSITEIEDDIAINLVNINWATEGSFPVSPSLIPIGGLHIKPVQPLPEV